MVSRSWPLAAVGAGCVIAAVWHPQASGAIVCPLRAATGIWCPGCGMTRAALALGRFDASAAWRFHPWVWALAIQFVAFAVIRATGGRSVLELINRRFGVATGPGGPGGPGGGDWLGPRSRELLAQQVIWFNLIALVAVWAVRYALGALPIAGG